MHMSSDNDRALAMLTSREERLKRYLRETPSPDDIVRNVTTAFAGDVARIMASVQARSEESPSPRQKRSPTKSQR
jgi:hypothetical protein